MLEDINMGNSSNINLKEIYIKFHNSTSTFKESTNSESHNYGQALPYSQ